MKTEIEIRDEIKNITNNYWHVLNCYPATTEVNAPRALMQVEAVSVLDALYGVLGRKRPKFRCDEINKQNH